MEEESTTLWAEVRKNSFFFGLGLAVYMCGHFPVCLECLIEKTDSRRDRQSIVIDPNMVAKQSSRLLQDYY